MIFQFVKYSCGFFALFLLILTSVLPALMNLVVSEWVRRWVKVSEASDMKSRQYAYKYFGIVLIFFICNVLRNYVIAKLTLIQSQNMHDDMSRNILHSHHTFYDENPSGRLISRFSKDIGVVDSVLPVVSTWFALFFFRVIAVFCLISVIIPWLALIIFIISVLTLYLRHRCLKVLRRAMKLDAKSKAPLLAQISNTLNGLSSIRVFRKKHSFNIKFQANINQNSRAFLTVTMLSRAFQFLLDLFCAILVFATLVVSLAIKADPLVAAMIIQMVNDLMGTFQTALRMSVDLENSMTSVNRCLDYTNLPLEETGPFYLDNQRIKLIENQARLSTHRTWVREGRLQFIDASLRYRANLPMALRQFNLDIQPCGKIGIVGRTGAGKSSILKSLLRTVELNTGSILLDGVDISKISLYALRTNVTFIPQTPFLFQGSIRQNLDPLGSTDLQIWQALQEVQLAELIRKHPRELNTPCQSVNFSQGQKQLLCLARGMLKRNKVIVMDEPTANIDGQTDEIIQRAIRKCFKQCTVITIAHRLNSLVDSDLVVVLNKGEIEERSTLRKYSLDLDVPDPPVSECDFSFRFASSLRDLIIEQMSFLLLFRNSVRLFFENPLIKVIACFCSLCFIAFLINQILIHLNAPKYYVKRIS